MGLGARNAIYIIAVVALVVGVLAYGLLGEEHEEEGLLEGDLVRVVSVGSVLGVVAVASFLYLLRKPPQEP